MSILSVSNLLVLASYHTCWVEADLTSLKKHIKKYPRLLQVLLTVNVSKYYWIIN